MIKVLIVEDSQVKSQYLEYILNSDKEIEVVGNVANGKLAIEFLKKNKADIITMDIEMPVMDGIEATQRIMASNPVPIIIVTARKDSYKIMTSMDALSFGALSVVDQPFGMGNQRETETKNKLISLIKLLSKVKVVTRKHNLLGKQILQKQNVTIAKDKKEFPPINIFLNRKIVAIGVSSGGPQVLVKIFSKISGNFPYPIVVVQHITEGFLEGMVNWLRRLLNVPIHVASDNEVLLPGHIYFAPDMFQMGVNYNRIKLYNTQKENNICPSVDYLFKSLSSYNGKDVIAMILTGMGRDGAQGIKKLRDAGAVTIAQDNESSLVFGMPREAITLNGIDYVQSSDNISELLLNIENHSN